MKKRRISFLVSFEMPDGLSECDAEIYAREALSTWMRCKNPDDDPTFDIRPSSVKVRRFGARKAVKK